MSSMPAATSARAMPDRRRRQTPMFSRYWLRGRRRGGRRAGETARIYLDGYTAGEWTLVLALLILSAVDLVSTLGHVAAGGAEANPLMAWTLTVGGIAGFVGAKLFLTGAAALVLLVHVRFRLARRALEVLVGVYFLVMAWHVVVGLDRLAV